MAALKSIQDAIISRIASQATALNTRTVKPWSGTVDDFFEDGARIHNLPFCGVNFVSSDPTIEVFDNAVAQENYTWELTIIASDGRGQQYSNEEALDIIDDIRTALIGHVLSGQAGVAPLIIGAIAAAEEVPEQAVTVYTMDIHTWQVQQ